MRASWERDDELARTLRPANACFCDPHHEAMRRSPAAFTVIQITSAIASGRLVFRKTRETFDEAIFLSGRADGAQFIRAGRQFVLIRGRRPSDHHRSAGGLYFSVLRAGVD